MATSRLYVPILIAGMIITGSANSLWSKWQDMQCVENCDDPDSRHHVLYEQPVWQTLQMFLGEMLCFLPVLYSFLRARYQPAVQLPPDDNDHLVQASPQKKTVKAQQLRGYRVLLLWLPAACDLTGTTLMNVGLLYTPVSIYQMTRGALVLFVGILSVLFLHRRLWFYQWLSLVTVMLGSSISHLRFLLLLVSFSLVAWMSAFTSMRDLSEWFPGVSIVGLSGSMIKDTVKETVTEVYNVLVSPSPLHTRSAGSLNPDSTEAPEATKVLVGIFFILFAQIFTATQFVVEEKILSRYSVAPLVAVGYEGLFGALTILVFMPALGQLADRSTFFDLPRGWHQMIDTPTVLWSGIVIACSIALFNFFGLSVTRHVSATARSLTDTCRTLSIWIVSLALGWELLLWPISLLQILGFALLVYGTFLFNGLVDPPKILRPRADGEAASPELGDPEERAHLVEEALEETAVLPADLGQSGFDVVPKPAVETHSRSE